MGQLQNLKGTNGYPIDCLFIEKGSDIIPILKNHYAATSAGDNGAINIYFDVEFNIRCEAMRNFFSLEDVIFEDIEDAVKWADEWIIKIS